MNVLLIIALIVLILVVIGIIAFFIYKSMTNPRPPPTGSYFQIKSSSVGSYLISTDAMVGDVKYASVFSIDKDGNITYNDIPTAYKFAGYGTKSLLLINTTDKKLVAAAVNVSNAKRVGVYEIKSVEDALENNYNLFGVEFITATKPPPPTTTKPIPIPTGTKKVIFAVKSNGNYIALNGQTPNQADALIFQLASDGTIYLNNKKWLFSYSTYNNDGMFIMTQDGKLYGYRMDDQDSPIVEISSVQDALKNNNNEFALTVKNI